MNKIIRLTAVISFYAITIPVEAQVISMQKIGGYNTNIYDGGSTEIAGYDPATKHLFSVNGNTGNLDILDITDPTNPIFLQEVDLSAFGGGANSVSVKNGIVAVAVEAVVKQDPGMAVFFDANGTYLNALPVGSLPDMITFTPNGKRVLVANEGEPNSEYTIDPVGSVSIINISGGVALATAANVTTVDFTKYDTLGLPEGVRLFGPGATPSMDLEPEYIAISKNSKTAYVTLQEANAIAIINIQNATVDVVPMGYKDYMLPENTMDASDKNGGVVNFANWPVLGLYQPDAIDFFSTGGLNYLITANEGDTRDYTGYSEISRVSSLMLDSTQFPNAADLKLENNLGRLYVTKSMGDNDGDGDYDSLYTFGGRSFSILSTSGEMIYDSGNMIETITNNLYPSNFNCSSTSNTKKGRSDDKGPEPEGVVTAKILDSIYAFIGLERIGGIMVFNITNPTTPVFSGMINTRNFSETPGAGTGGDLAPEGLLFIPANQSPNGRNLLVASYEVSGSIGIYQTDNSCSPNRILICSDGLTYCVKPTLAAAMVADGATYGPCDPLRAVDPISIEENLNATLTIYPNPAHEIVYLDFTEQTGSDFNLSIYNAAGELMYTQPNQSPESVVSINVENLPSGIYLVQLSNADTVLNSTFIKQ